MWEEFLWLNMTACLLVLLTEQLGMLPLVELIG